MRKILIISVILASSMLISSCCGYSGGYSYSCGSCAATSCCGNNGWY